ncbi:hypothetical protein MM221_09965 [Salipaludibacillus sp. LMS25]|jgi:hypothetical protein|uniref:hypothetical protein n=1 Tax=Salipaludibacillus sp. LMS25 TaxID=2924031 RepID=UPI0020D0D394|nr:hypothetical protein [Salipaludibacillus sp. LMS25]UTR16807.1 hypothetical protein MM221_09965 [Salipaludibacillus sp. LMS25]
MSIREKRWRRFYTVLFIFLYGCVIPINLLVFFSMTGERFPFIPILVGIILPFTKKRHLEQVRQESS